MRVVEREATSTGGNCIVHLIFFLVYYAVAKVEQIEAGALDAYS